MRRLMILVTLITLSTTAHAGGFWKRIKKFEPEKQEETIVVEESTPILVSIGDSIVEFSHSLMDIVLPDVKVPNDVPKREIKCLADNIYFEAKNEPIEGKLAVAEVTLNRVEHPQYPNTVCGVVWQQNKDRRTGRKVAQFSWTLDGKPDVPRSKETYEEIYALAEEVLLYGMDSAIVGPEALFYHATYVKPRWSRSMVRVMRIGNHVFYQPRS